jgi:cell division protein FtsB
MRGVSSFLTLAQTVAWRALAITIVGVLAGYAVFGANGVLAWGDYSQRLEARKAELVSLDLEKARLANRVALLNPNSANPDMVDELVRRDLGLAQPDEVIIPLD